MSAPLRARALGLGLGWVGALVLASSPAAADSSGVTITAFAGAGYLLDTTERPGAWSARSMFDFTGGASISGGFIRPQLLRWSGNIAYLGNRQAVHQGAITSLDAVVFGARVSLIPGTPTPITLFANRTYTDSSEISPRRSTGSTMTTGFGGAVAVNFLDYPRLTGSLSRHIVDTTRGDGRKTTSGLTSLRLGVGQQLKRLEYSGAYDTNWSNGSFDDLQYGSHNVAVRAAAPLSPALQFVVNEQYFVRLPTTQAPTNPRYEANSFTSQLVWRRSERLTAGVGYANLQSSIFAPTALDQATSAHSLSETLQWKWRDDLIISQQLGSQYATSRVGVDQFRGARGDLGAGLSWLRPTHWGGTTLGGGATFGVAGDESSVAPSWGAHLDAQAFWRAGWLTGSGVYSLVYSDTGTRLFGRTFRQNLRLETIYLPAPSWKLRAFFAGSGARKDDAVVGTALQRSLQAILEAGYRQHQLQLFAGYGDGLPESLGHPLFADGLFLPAPYNSQYANFGGTLSTALFSSHLVLRATGRFSQTSGLGRTPEQEVGLTFTGSYTLGKFVLTAEDRVLLGYADSFWYRNNTLMLRLTRDFDWSF